MAEAIANYTLGISEKRSGVSTFYGHDRLGSNNLQETSSSTVSYKASYDAFGLVKASTGSTSSPFGFVGQAGYQTDNNSGLMLLGHRYYDASTGRFLTRDPIKDGDNWYDYCDNNPTEFVDENGEFIIALILIGVATLAVIGYHFYKHISGAGAAVDSNQAKYKRIDGLEAAGKIDIATAQAMRLSVETGQGTRQGLHDLGGAAIDGEKLSLKTGFVK